MKTLLICGNGLSGEAISFIKEWGYKVALISEFPNDRGVDCADYFIQANSKEPAEALLAAEILTMNDVHFDGIVSLCWDSAISVATIAEAFGLISVSVESAVRSTLKDLRSRVLLENNISAPKYSIVESFDSLLAVIGEYGYPVILKPSDQSSSKGVIKVKTDSDLFRSYEVCRASSDTGKVIVNEYLLGTEHSTEGLMIGGKLHLTAISDRVFEYEKYEPFFIEIGDIMPTVLSAAQQQSLYELTQKAAMALGIRDGVVKGDLIVCEERGGAVLELTPRLGGPRFGTEMVPLSNGTNILKATIQQAMGEPVDMELLKPKHAGGMVNRSIFPSPGKLVEDVDLGVLEKQPGFYDFKWWKEPLSVGDVVEEYTYGCGNVAYFIAVGEDRESAIRNADNIESKITIKTSVECQ